MSSSATPSKMAAVARPCIAVARVVRACLALRASSVPSLYPPPHPWQTEQIGALYRQMLAHEGIDPYWVGIEVSACKSAQAWARR